MTTAPAAATIEGRPDGAAQPRAAAAQDPVLRFLHESLGLEHLHYGLWDGNDRQVSLPALRRAQERYARKLLEVIATLPVRDILDAGCGFGTNARLFKESGYRVALLSPDPYQLARIADDAFAAKHLARFEDFAPAPDERCDLVLMSESSQYIRDLDRLFAAADGALREPGFVLIADYFTKSARGERTHPIERSGHPIAELRAKARAAGFTIERDEDVSEAVLPTLELAARVADEHVGRALRDLDLDFRAKCGPGRPLRRWARRQLKYRALLLVLHWAQRKLETDFRPRIDPDAFRRLKEYRILVLRR